MVANVKLIEEVEIFSSFKQVRNTLNKYPEVISGIELFLIAFIKLANF